MKSSRWRLPLLLMAAGLLLVLVATVGPLAVQTRAARPMDQGGAELPPQGPAGLQLSPTLPPTFTPAAAAYAPLATFTPSPTPFLTALPSPIPATDTTTPTARPTRVATPIPTYTLPPQGDASASGATLDHYWLERPIPAEYANWTDRVYPYGSTRGGTLPTHHGVEFINPVNVPVLAAGAGTVVTAGRDDQVTFGPQTNYYGNLVIIRHDQLYRGQYLYTLYGHLAQVLVTEGQPVTAGDLIGLVGGTGVANGGAHLHFEVRVGANSFDATRNPELWLRPFPGWGTIAGQLLWPDGSQVQQAPLSLRRADDPTRFVGRTIYTYADGSVNPDDDWQENFTTPDLEPGLYELAFRYGDAVRRELVWVYPNQTAFITIQLDTTP